MSTALITYLNFIAGLKNATDDQITDIIKERAKFIGLGDSDMMAHSESAINGIFDEIDLLARQLEEEEIAQESVKLAEDAAAVAAIWSFGLSMAVFAALEITDTALDAAIKQKEKELYNHLNSADKNIADRTGEVVSEYADLFKKNNDSIKANSPTGLTPQTARSYLYNFMDYISVHADGGVTVDNFRKYIEVASLTKDDANIEKIYDILDEFTLSDRGPEAIKNALTKINSVGLDTNCLEMVRGFTYDIWVDKMEVSAEDISKYAEEVGIPPEEVEISVLENMDILGKAMAAITIVVSIVDAFLNVYNIVETVKRYNENIKIFNDARQQYKDYYKHLYDASVKYNPKSA